MKKWRFIGATSLLATVALAGMPALVQAAPPELGRCVKLAGGKYIDPGCEKGAGTKYEWYPGAIKNHFTSSEAKSTLEGTLSKLSLICTSDTDTGEYVLTKEDKETITFKGCKTKYLGSTYTCENVGPGEIETTLLTSVLGFIKSGSPIEVGVSLEGSPTFVEYECGPYRTVVTGSVIGRVTPISKMTTTFKEKFTAPKGIQKPEKFESQPKDTLHCEVYKGITLELSEQCGFTSADTVTNEEALEVNEVL